MKTIKILRILHISMFCKIVEKLINIDANGIYNLSLGKRCYLMSWLNG